MIISRNLLLFLIIIILNDIKSYDLRVESSRGLFSDRHSECDYNKYKNGCKDSIGSVCLDDRCVCRQEFYIKSITGYCLKPAPMGQECQTSRQCAELDINSLCFASNDNLNQGVCHCKHNYYFDENRAKCLMRLSIGHKCHTSVQCLGRNSVCNRDNVCDCEYNYYFEVKTNDCKHNNSNRCNEDQEWNEFIDKCQTKVYYSFKGGGRGGGGRGGGRGSSGGKSSGRGGRLGGGGSIRGHSWWSTSWFGRRSGGYGGGSGGTYYEDDDEDLAWDKVLFILLAVIIIIMACCYCSYKFRQQDKDAEHYWNNRSKRPVPKIVIKGAEDVNQPLVNNMVNEYKRMSRSSEVGLPNGVQRSRSPSTSSRAAESLPTVEHPVSSSPPPPYSPINTNSVILPFATSVPSQQKTTQNSGTNSPRLSPTHCQQLVQNPNQMSESSKTNSLTTSPGHQIKPQSSPHSEQVISVNSSEPLRHPDNPNLILPFASVTQSANP